MLWHKCVGLVHFHVSPRDGTQVVRISIRNHCQITSPKYCEIFGSHSLKDEMTQASH